MVNIENLISKAKWRATDYIEAHEYIIKEQHPELFELMRQAIKTDGYSAKFRGASYRYINIGAYKYWTMGVVLNRSKIKENLKL